MLNIFNDKIIEESRTLIEINSFWWQLILTNYMYFMECKIPEGVKHDTSYHPHAKNYKIEIFIKLNRENSKLSFVFLLTTDSRISCFLSSYLEKSQEAALHLSSCRDTADKKNLIVALCRNHWSYWISKNLFSGNKYVSQLSLQIEHILVYPFTVRNQKRKQNPNATNNEGHVTKRIVIIMSSD